MPRPVRRSAALAPLLAAALTAALVPAATAAPTAPRAGLPSYISALSSVRYDGAGDDLLTAGLGFSGLSTATPPAPADPDRPTAAELRRQAIWASAGLSAGSGGGLGRLYGPNVDRGRPVPGDGKVAGVEYRAVAGSGSHSVSFVVQVRTTSTGPAPASSPRPPPGWAASTTWWAPPGPGGCTAAARSPTPTRAWAGLRRSALRHRHGLRRHDRPRAQTADRAAFDAGLSDTERARFDAERPYRVAYKMAHAKTNPQATWGRDVLRSVELALALLDRDWRQGAPRAGYTPATTTVLATGVSNGGGAAVAAGEDDHGGLIDAVVASEPQMNLAPLNGIRVTQGGRAVPAAGLPLIRYGSLASLLQPCAALTEPTAPGYSSLDTAAAHRRCAALVGDDPRLISRRDAKRAALTGCPGWPRRPWYAPDTSRSPAISSSRTTIRRPPPRTR
ncbi:3-hydroxybutyrate oligomer hydrolase family protein [Streptomyces sp. FXJ1.4098]|nr:3-hydroxybutyrate oligomer hydrolase family protein [Streptomyces sp. FXJ1.4098]